MAKANAQQQQPQTASRGDRIRDRLQRLDESESHDVTSWECEFIESVVYRYAGPLSQKQLDTAERILNKYGF